jgi:DNA replication protein DnaC
MTNQPEPFGSIAHRAALMAERAAAGELDTPEDWWDPNLPRVVVDLAASQAEPAWMPARFAHAQLADLTGQVRGLADRWTDGGMNANVLLLGNVGVGKTHAACAMARQAWQAGSSVSFVPVVELLDQLRPQGDPDAYDRAIRVDVLVLDDLGGERPTDWTGERLYAIVNRRWLEQRPTLVTSNLAPHVLEQQVGPRVFSRLYHEALRLTVGGSDRRRAEQAAGVAS